MRVTVLTPTLNAERYLPDCLASVRSQTISADRVEHLVLDGESVDATARLAREAGAVVSVRKDSSLYEAMNRGVALARGDVIGWLNADDVYQPDALERVMHAFVHAPDAEVVVGDYALAGGSRVQRLRTHADALARIRRGERRGTWIAPIAVFFRASTLRGLGEFAATYRIAADLDLWIRAAAREPPLVVAHTGSVVGTFRMHEGSLSTGSSPERSLLESIRIGTEWAADARRAEGIRRYGVYVRRRDELQLLRWRTRNTPAPRRLWAAARAVLALRRLAPGVLDDVREQLLPFALELLRGGSERSWT